MSKGVKILLIVLGVGFLSFVGVIAVGVFYVKSQLPNIEKVGKEITLEAATYGKSRHDRDCVKKTMEKSGKCGEYAMKCRVKVGIFLTACLEVAKESPDFCKGVPKETDFIDSATWRIKKCEAFSGVNPQVCQQTLAPVQKHCHK